MKMVAVTLTFRNKKKLYTMWHILLMKGVNGRKTRVAPQTGPWSNRKLKKKDIANFDLFDENGGSTLQTEQE